MENAVNILACLEFDCCNRDFRMKQAACRSQTFRLTPPQTLDQLICKRSPPEIACPVVIGLSCPVFNPHHSFAVVVVLAYNTK